MTLQALQLSSEFEDLGVDHSTLKKTSDATGGVVVILVDKNGERTMFPETGANSGLVLADMPPAWWIRCCICLWLCIAQSTFARRSTGHDCSD